MNLDQPNKIYKENGCKKRKPLPEIKESLIKRKLKHWNEIFNDYVNVFNDSLNYVKKKPVKFMKYGALASALVYCAKLNPDVKSFEDHLLRCSAEIGILSLKLQNKVTAAHIEWVKQQHNLKKLKRFNFLIFSIVYLEKMSQTCCKYETNCNYLNLWPSEFKNRIVDIGFLNKWWVLEKYMKDYDINF